MRLAVILVAAVYIAFLALDLFAPNQTNLSSAFKFAGILLCVAVSALNLRRSTSRRSALLLFAALLFTAIADVFLLFSRQYVMGVVIFCFAHAFHQLRLYPKLLPVSSVCAAAAVVVAAAFSAKLLYCVSAFYAILLLFSFVSAIRCALPRSNKTLAVAGMALFVLCDINVALYNLAAQSSAFYSAATVLMWFFYLPAQLLLALSGRRFETGTPLS